ncbi:MAG: hypothetical protein C5B50_09580 [Verrucomicrobia bacterium]|nr:MAG: hypothetical protein C5B50_09580 [Verrucomicrobiota bacterium]
MPDPFERELAVFSAARRLLAAERPAYLDKTCAGDAALRVRVEELLAAAEKAQTFLKDPAPGAERPANPPVAPTLVMNMAASAEKAGDRIGHYKLLQQIGEGGCGLVYMAEQEEPVRRRVALKVIKLGMDTKSVIARFEAERQALAMMDHPNIAKVLDAGATEAGRPYFVMELVRGIKITDYCDEHNLSTNERLELFMQVCHAVQHAHQKGIIHRDLKPSNILVASNDGVPVPKVIDFGIAKATQGRLTDQTVFTAFEQFIGTPAYMSPEQAELTMQDVDTRTDIYSLGVLLYELLTGKTPFDAQQLLASGLDAMRRTIREQEPARPSTRLSTMLVAADVSRPKATGGLAVRSEEEVSADSRRRLRLKEQIKMVRGDLDWIVMKCLEKDRARRYETANGLSNDVRRHLNCEPVTARPPSRLYELQKSVRRHKFGFAAAAALIAVLAAGVVASTLEALRATHAQHEQARLRLQADQARTRAEAGEKKAETEAARSEQVATLMKGMLQGVGPSRALGRDTSMLREILDQTGQRLNDLKGQAEVEADLRATLGRVYTDLGEYTNAVAMHQRALELRKSLHPGAHPDVAESLNDLGQASYWQGKYPEADALHRQALAMRQSLFGEENLQVAQSLNNLGETLRKRGIGDPPKLTAAEPLLRKSVAIRRKLLANDDLDVANSLFNLGALLWRQKHYADAEAAQCEALAIRRKRLAPEHPDIATSLDRLCLLLDAQGRQPEAETAQREALAMRRKLLGNDHPDVAHSLQNLAFVLIAQGRLEEAEIAVKEAFRIRQARLPPDHGDRVQTLESLVNVLRRQGKLSEIETLYRDELKLRQQGLGNDHPVTAAAVNALVEVLFAQKKVAEAEALLREEVQKRKSSVGRPGSAWVTAVLGLAKVLAEAGKVAEAERLVTQELESLTGQSSNQDPTMVFDLGRVIHGFGKTARDRGNLDLAERSLRLAIVPLERAVAISPTQTQYRLELSIAYGDLNFAKNSGLENIRQAIATLDRALQDLPSQRQLFLEQQAHNYRKLGFRSLDMGMYPVAREAFAAATRFLRESAESPGQKPFCLQGEADDLLMIGDAWSAEGRTAEAHDAYRQSLRIHELIEEQDLAKQIKAGWMVGHYDQLDQLIAKVATAEDALRIARVMRPIDLKTPAAVLSAVVSCHFRLAEVLRKCGKSDDAESLERGCRQGVLSLGESSQSEIKNVGQRLGVAEALHLLADLLLFRGNWAEAEEPCRESVQMLKALLQERMDFPRAAVLIERLATDSLRLVGPLRSRGKSAEADAIALDAVQRCQVAMTNYDERAFNSNPQNGGWSLAVAQETLAELLRGLGRTQEAEKGYRNAQVVWRKLLGVANTQDYRNHLAANRNALANLLREAGKSAEAEALEREEADRGDVLLQNEIAWRWATDPDPGNRNGSNAVFYAQKAVSATCRTNISYLDTLAAAYAEAGQFEKASSIQREANALAQSEPEKKDRAFRLSLYESKHPYREHGLLAERVMALLGKGEFAEAEAAARECLALREKQIPDDWRAFNARSMLGGALLGKKKYAEAEPQLLSGYGGMMQHQDQIPGIGRPRLKETLERLVQLYEATNRPDQAAEWKQKLADYNNLEKQTAAKNGGTP